MVADQNRGIIHSTNSLAENYVYKNIRLRGSICCMTKQSHHTIIQQIQLVPLGGLRPHVRTEQSPYHTPSLHSILVQPLSNTTRGRRCGFACERSACLRTAAVILIQQRVRERVCLLIACHSSHRSLLNSAETAIPHSEEGATRVKHTTHTPAALAFTACGRR